MATGEFPGLIIKQLAKLNPMPLTQNWINERVTWVPT